MPEGPSLVILREEAARFEGQHIIAADANTAAFAPARRRSFFCERYQKRYPRQPVQQIGTSG